MQIALGIYALVDASLHYRRELQMLADARHIFYTERSTRMRNSKPTPEALQLGCDGLLTPGVEARPMRVRLRTFGQFEFSIGDVRLGSLPTQKSRALLAYLALNYRLETPRERLVELFWSEMEPARAREGLRTALSTIRRAFRDAGIDADAAVAAGRNFIRLNLTIDSDAKDLEVYAQSDAESDWRSAVNLYAGEFLDGNYEEWAVARREHYATMFENILVKLVQKTSDVKAARLLLARNPYDEHAYATLLDSELEAQRMTAARELFARYLTAMNEAAIEPSRELLVRFASLADRSETEVRLPFVARQSELANIERGLAALSGGKSYAAMIVGEPGIGKTALIERAADIAERASCCAFVVRSSAGQSHIGAVWGALYQRITGESPERAAATAVDVPALIASAVAERLPKPAILFVDDAHALGGEALATLVELARLARSKAFGLVITTRPEGLAGAALILAPYVDERIELGPLCREDVDTALTLALTNLTPQFSAALFARSGGHPLFLISLLESLVRARTLDRERGRWRVTRELGAQLALPQDLRSSIETRLRAAGNDAAVVACALSLEPSAAADDLAAALGYEHSIVLDALDRLLGFALIREDIRGEFLFSHDIVREVASALLNAGRRVALHHEFARRYERDLSRAAQPKRARHLKAAGMIANAADAYIRSVRDAIDAYAFHDALQFCSDAIDCLEHLPPSRNVQLLRAQVKVLVTEAALQTGAFDLASSAAGDAARAARSAGDAEAIGAALVSRAALDGILGDATRRVTDAREALQLSARNTNSVLAARAGVQISAFARAAGRFDDAVAAAREAGANAVAASDPGLEYAGKEELIRAQISWWRFAEAEQEIIRARPIAEAAGVSAQARLHCISGWFNCMLERFDAANRALVEAAFLARQLAERRDSVAPDTACPLILVRFTVHFLEGLVALAQDRFDDALGAVDRCRGVVPLASLAPYRDAAAKLELTARVKAHEELRQEYRAPTESLPCPLLFTVDSAKLWQACVGVGKSTENVRAALRAGLDDLEERTNAMQIDCDRAFALLASAASDAGQPIIAARAKARADHYHAARMAAAALHRSIRPRISSGSMPRPSA